MKSITLLFALFMGITVFGQSQYADIVYPAENGDTISNCNIIKVKEGNVVLFEHHGVVQKLAAKAIVWDSKYYDLVGYLEKGTATSSSDLSPEVDPEKEKQKQSPYLERGDNDYAALGVGFGNAYGGIGGQFQIRGGKTLGFGLHLGAGFIPGTNNGFESSFGWNGGVKFYYFKALFLDVTYGVVTLTSYGNTGKGPSLLLGGDFILSKRVGLNVAAGMSRYSDEYGFTMDLGLLIKLPHQKKRNNDKEVFD